jgi:hypothetical protein
MGVLEQVMELKGRGVPENEIISMLEEQRVSPGEIDNALNQAKIKSAVSSEKKKVKSRMEPSIMGPEGAEPPPRELPTEGAVSDVDLTPVPPPQYQGQQLKGGPVSKEISEEYIPSPQGEGYEEAPQYQEAQYQPEQYQDYYPQQEYGYGEYASAGISDTDTLIEIAEQVFFEKIKPLQKQIENLNEFKILAQTKIENISDRLKRIELNIDKLQAEILEKVGSYGRGLEGVKREMGMVQESFGKIVNTLADKKEIKYKHHILKKTSPVKRKISRPIKKISKKK